MIFFVILCLVLFLAISPFNKYSKREITIIGQKPNTDSGQAGFVSPSNSKERVNLLFLGIPGKDYHGEKMTDTIIVVSTTPKGEKPIGISIPRDLLVRIPEKDQYTKINALYDSAKNEKQGIEMVAKKLNEITNLNFNYFVVFDLEGVKGLIDKLGGIDVVVRENIYDPLFPAPYDSYQVFSIKKGIHHLDGETALKYIRSRNQIGGDFARIQRQQEVINILKNRILSLNFIWDFPTILSVWKTLKNNTYTNIDITDIKYAWNLVKKTNLDEIKFYTISNLDENQFLVSEETTLENQKAYVLKPKAGLENYEEIKNYINQLINEI